MLLGDRVEKTMATRKNKQVHTLHQPVSISLELNTRREEGRERERERECMHEKLRLCHTHPQLFPVIIMSVSLTLLWSDVNQLC